MRMSGENITSIRTKAEFEEIFRAWYAPLCAYAFGFMANRDATEEVVQEVMFKLWVNREKTTFTASPKAYLFGAVRNACLNELAHRKVVEKHRMAQEEKGFAASAETDPLIASELEKRIQQAINALPSERKKIFILSRYESLTYAEIAQQLGISVKTVENQMSKALKTLREELSEYLPLVILLASAGFSFPLSADVANGLMDAIGVWQGLAVMIT